MTTEIDAGGYSAHLGAAGSLATLGGEANPGLAAMLCTVILHGAPGSLHLVCRRRARRRAIDVSGLDGRSGGGSTDSGGDDDDGDEGGGGGGGSGGGGGGGGPNDEEGRLRGATWPRAAATSEVQVVRQRVPRAEDRLARLRPPSPQSPVPA